MLLAPASFHSAAGPRILPVMSHRILIVDDQMESVALLLGYLKGQAFEVMVALSGSDGLRKAADGLPDAILLDVTMPGMDGYAVCRSLKSDPRTAHAPVIFLSANTSVANRLEGFAAGGVDYVGKPFSSEEVLARLFVHLHVDVSAYTGAAAVGTVAASPRGRDIVAEAVAEMQADGAQWNGLDALARSVGTNEKKLTELFRERFGLSVYEYLVELRLEKARWNLANTRLQIQLVAGRAGYLNASDFARAFRKRYGLGPRQYRQASRADAGGIPAPMDPAR